MKRYIDEIIVSDPVLDMDIIRGLETPRENCREYSVDLFECEHDPIVNVKPDSYRARIRIYAQEVVR